MFRARTETIPKISVKTTKPVFNQSRISARTNDRTLTHSLKLGKVHQYFQPTATRPTSFFLQSLSKRHIQTDSHSFVEVPGVYHITVTADKNDSKEIVKNRLLELMGKHPNSIIFLTQKSRILQKENPNQFKPFKLSKITVEAFRKSVKELVLVPEGGHTCMALTNIDGSIDQKTEVSLRPGIGTIISGQTILHQGIFKTSQSNNVKNSQHTTMEEEIETLAQKMLIDMEITANITIVPLSKSIIPHQELLTNIQSVRAIKLYNLCSTIVDKLDVDHITDNDIRKAVEELIAAAKNIDELKSLSLENNKAILAALACTQAIVKSCCGDMRWQETNDISTQTAVVYCVMALIGSDKFLAFARSISFHDKEADLTHKGFKS